VVLIFAANSACCSGVSVIGSRARPTQSRRTAYEILALPNGSDVPEQAFDAMRIGID
jgi:hypothetical protein